MMADGKHEPFMAPLRIEFWVAKSDACSYLTRCEDRLGANDVFNHRTIGPCMISIHRRPAFNFWFDSGCLDH